MRRTNPAICNLGSTWLPKWCPMAPKVAPRVPKGCQNEEKMPSKASKCGSKTSRKKRSSNESVSVREQGRGRGRSRRKGRGHATANRDIETNFYPSPNGGPSSKVYYTKWTNPYFRLLNCFQNGYQNRVKIQKNTWTSKELPTRLARRRPPCQPGG